MRQYRYICYILVAVLFLQGCNLAEKKKTFTIAFSQCVGDDAWRQTMLEEMKRELSFYPNVQFIYLDAENSSERQIKQLHMLIREKPDLIIVSPNEAEPLTPVVDRIFQNGIPVVVTDRKTSSGLYNAYVGADNFEIGYMAGQYLAKQLNNQGNISEITGLPGSSANIERQKGLHEALKLYPGINIQTQIDGQWLIDVARKKVFNEAERLAASDAIFAYNDQMALGSHQALQQKLPGNSIKIMGVDALPGANNGLQFVAQHILNASMLYPTGGKECIQTAMAILKGLPYQRENILGTLVVDAANVQLMKLQSDKIINQQKDIDKQQELFAEQEKIFSSQQRVLNILVISLVLAVVFAGIAFYSLKANWEKNKQLEIQNGEILEQQQRVLEMTKEVEKATEAKINFFTNISHEFKTPISLMLLPLEDLIKNAKISEETGRSLSLIRKNALTLQNLVSQLIDLRRAGYENLKIKAQQQNILVFCNNIVQSFRPLAKRKCISLRLENRAENSILWFDPDLMEKLLYNLLSNAFKFTPEKGEIVLKLGDADGGNLEIQVIDNGIGIADRDIEHLFEPFYQGEKHYHGSGIGLALGKEIVTLHRGTIAIQSQKDAGTTVIIGLPIGSGHLQEEEKVKLAPQKKEKGTNEINTLLAVLEHDADREKAVLSICDPEFDKTKPYSILIIEDHAEMREFLATKLSETYNVFTASNSQAGLRQAHQQVPDLIISDVLMPGELGTELVRKLKADVRTTHIPVILLTARGSDEQKLTGLHVMADAYITKPFHLDHLLAQIDNLICNRKALQNYYGSEVAESQPQSGISQSDKHFLNELAAVIEEHIADTDLNVDYLCSQLSISRMQLYRRTKSLLQCSINDYITARRLRKAKLLLQQDVPVNMVAYQSGFSSPAYFSTAFKNKYGFTPSHYKKNQLDYSNGG